MVKICASLTFDPSKRTPSGARRFTVRANSDEPWLVGLARTPPEPSKTAEAAFFTHVFAASGTRSECEADRWETSMRTGSNATRERT